jgi:hypothetical protein
MNSSPCEMFSPERPSEGSKEAEILVLRKKVYLVMADRLGDGIKEFDVDQKGRLLCEDTATPSGWSFERSGRLGNYDRRGDIALERDEEVPLEDRQSNKYFTYDMGKAAVRYAEMVSGESEAAAAKAACDQIIFLEPEDIGDRLGLTPVERTFFRLPKKN